MLLNLRSSENIFHRTLAGYVKSQRNPKLSHSLWDAQPLIFTRNQHINMTGPVIFATLERGHWKSCSKYSDRQVIYMRSEETTFDPSEAKEDCGGQVN